jgi:hypothetical protein
LKTGITFTSSSAMTPIDTTRMVAGYTIAPFTLRFSASAFSM